MPSGKFLADDLVSGRKPRTVLQNEAAECGLACLAMIASAYDHNVSLSELRRRFAISAKGMTLRAILSVSDALNLHARPVKLDISSLRELKRPSILHWDLNHFVVLDRIKGDRLLIQDPARGERWVSSAEVDRSFTGVAVEFSPTQQFSRQKVAERVSLGDLFGRVEGLVPSILQMFILACIMQLFGLLAPILNQVIVDEAITKGDIGLLNVLAIGSGFLVLTTAGIKLLQGWVGLYLGTQMSLQAKTNLLRHTLRLPVAWFEKRHIGDIASRFSSMQAVQDFLIKSVPSLALNSIIAIMTLVVMMIYSPTMSFIVIIFLSIVVISRLSSLGYINRMTDQGLHLDSKVQTTFLETIRGARSFKIFGSERERVAVWQNEQTKSINNQVKLAKLNMWGGSGSSIILGLQQVGIMFVGAQMVLSGDMSLGMLFAFQSFSGQFSNAAVSIANQYSSFRTLRVHLNRLADVVHADEERGLSRPEVIAPVSGRIEMRDVSFRYSDHEPYVLKNVNLIINQGEFVCFQGPSGQGKTTILKLLLGFEEPQRGEILVDGVGLRQAGIAQFRHQIGVVLQDDQLFAGTISDNISFFDIDYSNADIERAAASACIHQEIISWPMGYQTFIGDLGSSLSAGQRQRLLLARALYRRPRILFLDEGTANLDPLSEESVMATIRSLDITRVVVAHRPRASFGASKVISVRDGALYIVSPTSDVGAPPKVSDPTT